MAKQIVLEEILSKSDISSLLNSNEFKDAVKKTLKNDRDLEKECEKKVRNMIADAVNSLFKGLWERNNFWKSIITNS